MEQRFSCGLTRARGRWAGGVVAVLLPLFLEFRDRDPEPISEDLFSLELIGVAI